MGPHEPDDDAAERHVREEVEIGRLSNVLAEQFHEDPTDVEPAVRDEFQRRSSSPIRDFVPVFVERSVRRKLRDTE